MASWFPTVLLAMSECLEPPNPSNIDATDEEVDAELLSLSNPWSDEGKGDWGGATHNSHCLWPQSWPCCGAPPHFWCTGWGPSLGTSHHSAAAGRLAGHGDESWLWKLNGVDAGEMEWGGQTPLVQCVLQWWFGWSTASHHPGLLVWHWVGLVCQPNWWLLTRLTWYPMPCPQSALLLMIAACRTGQPDLGQSLWLWLGQPCHLKLCLQQLEPAMHEVVVMLLSHLQWRFPVFPNNTESQVGQVLVSLLKIGMVSMMGCSQMPLGLQGHSSHLVVWGCGLQSGYWFKASDHLGCSIW